MAKDDCASVWFAILERSRNLGHRKREIEALQRLRAMGVDIRFDDDRTNIDSLKDEIANKEERIELVRHMLLNIEWALNHDQIPDVDAWKRMIDRMLEVTGRE